MGTYEIGDLCGKEAVVVKIKDDGTLRLEFVEISEKREWNFSEGMLRYKDAVINIDEAIDFESLWY